MGNLSLVPKLSWSEPQEFTTDRFCLVPRQAGVYRIRAFNSRGRPVPISRVNGTDQDALLHIGQSRDIATRIQQFHRSAQTGHGNHHAGNQFNHWKFEKKFPLRSLRFDYVPTEDRHQAIEAERWLHRSYREQYLDRPPLDGTSGQQNPTNR